MKPNMNGKKVLLIINPTAGKMTSKIGMFNIVDLFCKHGYIVTVQTTGFKGHATRIVLEQGKHNDFIVCCGGDGTLNEVISGVLKLGLPRPIGYIPAGTTNDFANTLKLSKRIETAARAILNGKPRILDIGNFNQSRYFSYIASFGAFTGSSYTTPQATKNSIGPIAYILEGIKDVPNIHPYHVRVEANGVLYEDDYIFGAVSNSTSIGGMVKLDSSLVDLNDGLFEIILIKNPKSAIELRKILISLNKKKYDKDMIVFLKANEATFYMDEPAPWSIDGEYEAGGREIRILNIPNAITLLI